MWWAGEARRLLQKAAEPSLPTPLQQQQLSSPPLSELPVEMEDGELDIDALHSSPTHPHTALPPHRCS